ncbi:MAG: hypothetical protein ACRCUY_03400 [Thermoguttaceae bacterium]
MSIRFRCIRCHHALKASPKAIGKTLYCPACYVSLTVPAESTIKDGQTDSQQNLYEIDESPLDRTEQKVHVFSVYCSICHTTIAATKSQVGSRVTCPDCGTSILVSEEMARKSDEALDAKLDKIMAGLGKPAAATYGIADGTTPPRRSEQDKKLISVYCKLCHTLMYATEKQIGSMLTCPDCDTKTAVPPLPISSAKDTSPSKSFEGNASFGLAHEPRMEQTGSGGLVPVICSICATRMYARESEIGGVKICPDCEHPNEIKNVPKDKIVPFEMTSESYSIKDDGSLTRPPILEAHMKRLLETAMANAAHEEMQERSEEQKKKQKRDKKKKTRKEIAEEQIEKERNNMESKFDEKFVFPDVERPDLPRFPLWTGLFRFFYDPRILARIVAFIGLMTTAIGVLIALYNTLFVVIGVICALGFSIPAIAILGQMSQILFSNSSAGNDKSTGDDWMSDHFLDGCGFTLWFPAVFVVAMLPGYFISYCTSTTSGEIYNNVYDLFYNVLLIFGSGVLFFPIMFLSSMETSSVFGLLAPGTCGSLRRFPFLWLRFYCLSGILCILALAAAEIVYTVIPISFLIPILITIAIITHLLYIRLLGRLAWTIEERFRQKRDAEKCETDDE